jgi:hypothetical protein
MDDELAAVSPTPTWREQTDLLCFGEMVAALQFEVIGITDKKGAKPEPRTLMLLRRWDVATFADGVS